MRPYLSDKAKFLLSRVDLEKSTDYGAVKRYILQEMQLTPSVYLDKFQSVSPDSTETYHQFANKLSSLFDYYVESRKVGSYEKLMELIVYDRIKASLPPFLSRHVLALESTSTLLEKRGWLGKHALVVALDAYTAGMAPPSSGNKAIRESSGGAWGKALSQVTQTGTADVLPRSLNPGELPQTGKKPDALNRGSIRETPNRHQCDGAFSASPRTILHLTALSRQLRGSINFVAQPRVQLVMRVWWRNPRK